MRLRRIVLADQRPHPLTARQYEILKLYEAGNTYDDIATITKLSWHTVKNYLTRARIKLNTHTSAQAVIELNRRMRNV